MKTEFVPGAKVRGKTDHRAKGEIVSYVGECFYKVRTRRSCGATVLQIVHEDDMEIDDADRTPT